jgi:hypothetical protein
LIIYNFFQEKLQEDYLESHESSEDKCETLKIEGSDLSYLNGIYTRYMKFNNHHTWKKGNKGQILYDSSAIGDGWFLLGIV